MVKVNSNIVSIRNIKGKTAYNPTVPFRDGGKTYMGVRIESLDSEMDSRTYFAHRRDNDTWEIDYSLPSFPLQDPAYMRINSQLVLSGVKVQDNRENIIWNQDIYRGDSIGNLELFAICPLGMKDIRLVDLEDRIGVFTRPQGKIGGLGRIGYFEVGRIDDLSELTESDWYSAELIDGLFDSNSWGGVNQAIRLPNKEIGVIGHRAYKDVSRDRLRKHYYAISFKFNTTSKSIKEIKTIAERKDFPPSPAKRNPELSDVIFPAGIDEQFKLYCGLSDYCVGVKKIDNPF